MEYINSIKNRFDKKTWFALCGAAFFSFLLFPSFFNIRMNSLNYPAASWDSLDASWKLLLNKANADGYVWGKDLVITYGPFGYLSTRLGWNIHALSLILFDLFVSFNFFCIFFDALIKSKSRVLTILSIMGLSFCFPLYVGSGNSLILLAFLVYWIRKSMDSPRGFYYVMQLFLLVLLFFMKFNTGLVSLVFFLLGLLYVFFVFHEKRKMVLFYSPAPFLLILVFCKLLHVYLPGYILGGLQMVSGYNGIMYLEQDFAFQLWGAATVFLLLIIFHVKKIYDEKTQMVKYFLLAFIFFSSLFILYKQAFVRKDIHHVLDFYKFGLLFLICGCDLFSERLHKFSYTIIGICVLVCVYFMQLHNKDLSSVFKRMNKGEYFRNVSNFTLTAGMSLFQNTNQIPPHIKQKIGSSSVDVYPWNIQLLIENDLNYNPRPVPQSYMAYTPYLEDLNFEHYNSSQGPQFVLYEHISIDERYPLFDEPKLNLLLEKNYSCVDTFYLNTRLMLVLEKKETQAIHLQKLKEFTMEITVPLLPAKDRYYTLRISHSFKGRCWSVLTHDPELSLIINTKDGKQNAYKTSVQLLATGIYSNRFISGTNRFKNINNVDSVYSQNEIVSYTFKPGDMACFEKEITVTEYKIAQ